MAKKEKFYELDFIDRSREIEKTCKTEIEGSEKGTKRKWNFFLKKFDEIRDESMKMKEVAIFLFEFDHLDFVRVRINFPVFENLHKLKKIVKNWKIGAWCTSM